MKRKAAAIFVDIACISAEDLNKLSNEVEQHYNLKYIRCYAHHDGFWTDKWIESLSGKNWHKVDILPLDRLAIFGNWFADALIWAQEGVDRSVVLIAEQEWLNAISSRLDSENIEYYIPHHFLSQLTEDEGSEENEEEDLHAKFINIDGSTSSDRKKRTNVIQETNLSLSLDAAQFDYFERLVTKAVKMKVGPNKMRLDHLIETLETIDPEFNWESLGENDPISLLRQIQKIKIEQDFDKDQWYVSIASM